MAPLAWTVFARPAAFVGVRARAMSTQWTGGARRELCTRRRMTRGAPVGWCGPLLDGGSSGAQRVGDDARGRAARGPNEAGHVEC